MNRRVLIADPAAGFCDALTKLLDSSVQISTCTDGATALSLLEHFQPNVLVIDLLLPEVDGLAVLKQAVTMKPRPACLVTLRHCSRFIEQALRNLEVDYVAIKPCSPAAIANRIYDLLTTPLESVHPLPSASELLIALNIPAGSRGYHLLLCAVDQFRANPEQCITKHLYPKVAQLCGSTPSSVEQIMRRVIRHAWEGTTSQTWIHCFGFCQDVGTPRPSNAKFISTIAAFSRPDDAAACRLPETANK